MMTRQPLLLLFDIDGTILRTGGAGMRAMYRTADRLFGPGFTWEGINPAGHLDPLIFDEVARLNNIPNHHQHHQQFHDHYLVELSLELDRSRHEVRLMPGIMEAIVSLYQRAQDRGDVVMGLLTGNYTRAVPIKLQAVGIEPAWFTITAFGDEAPTRAGLVKVAMEKFAQRRGQSTDPRRVVIIGDTPRDVACAKANGCLALAVATGGYSLATLQESGADLALADLSNLQPLLDWI